MPSFSDSRKSKKSKKSSKKCIINDNKEDIKNDVNNNEKIIETPNVLQEYSSHQSMVSLNNANNSCSSNSSITSPDSYLTSNFSTPIKRKTVSKSNIRFHQLFPSIPLDEIVISSNYLNIAPQFVCCCCCLIFIFKFLKYFSSFKINSFFPSLLMCLCKISQLISRCHVFD